MQLHAFISGPAGPLVGQALPVVLVGALVIYFAIALRNSRRQTPARTDDRVSPDQANTEEMLLEAAGALQIRFDRDSLLNPGAGSGQNKRIISGDQKIIGHTDYEPGYHEPLHIDPLATSLNPSGIPQVSLRRQPHKEKILVIPVLSYVNPGGGPDDYLGEARAIKRIAETVVLGADADGYPTGLLAANDTAGDGPVYLRPGLPVGKLIGMIRQLQPSNDADQAEMLRQALLKHARRIKGVVVISSFRHPSALELVANLPRQLKQTTVEVTSQWHQRLSDLPDRVWLDSGQGPDRHKMARLGPAHEEAADQIRIDIDQVLDAGPRRSHVRLQRQQPDLSGSLVEAIRQ